MFAANRNPAGFAVCWRVASKVIVLALRQEKRETFAGAAGFDEFAHGKFVATIAEVGQCGAKFCATIGQHYVALAYNGVAREAQGIFAGDFKQFADMLANDFLAVTIKGTGEPHGAAISKRTEAGIKMIEPRVHKLNGERQAIQEIADPLMRANVGSKTIAAEQHIAAKVRVAFALKNKVLWQSHNFVIVVGKPAFKVGRFALPFLMSKSATDEPGSHNQAGIGRENHVGQARLWFYRFDATPERL